MKDKLKSLLRLSLILLPLSFGSGCASSKALFYRDVSRTLEMAEKYGNNEAVACAKFIKVQLDWVKQVSDEETDGVISRAFQLYLIGMDAQGKEKQIEEACAPLVGMIAIKAMRQMK